jgi:predicted Fe-Mo cluster-binding NifX family protein
MSKTKNRFLAVPVENKDIHRSFGAAAHFNLYEIENGKIKTVTSISHKISKGGAIVGMLKTLGVDTIICHEIGDRARKLIADNGMELHDGMIGNADEAVKECLSVKR